MPWDPQGFGDTVRRQGAPFLGPALMTRHTARHRVIERTPTLVPETTWHALAALPLADAALSVLGTGWSLGNDLYGQRTWGEQLRWGLDMLAQGARLLRMGHTFGAAVLARQQLERWTFNVAHHHGVVQATDEGTADYFRRVWEVYPPVAERIDVGAAWIDLSELLHGRGAALPALTYWADAGDPAGRVAEVGNAVHDVHRLVGEVLHVTSLQVRGGIAVLVEEKLGREPLAVALRRSVVSVPDRWELAPLSLLAPLDAAVVTSTIMDEVVEQAAGYRRLIRHSGSVRKLETGINWDLSRQAVVERRARAVSRARRAFVAEARDLGPDFEIQSVHARLFRYIAIAEMAEVVASWSTGFERDALVTAGAALGSAWVFWLEDTDLSLPCVRTIFEQACRARTWRLKPRRAERVESSGSNVAPVRWIEAAGYGRLAVVSRALGEFAHTNARARWSGARGLLVDVQKDGTHGVKTARGNALDAAAYLLAAEVLARLEEAGEGVPAAFREAVTLRTATPVRHSAPAATARATSAASKSARMTSRKIGRPPRAARV